MIALITDSGCDISQKEAASLGVKILPILTIFGEKTYQDGIDIDSDTFYEKLANSKEFPHTAQINAFAYEEAIKEELDKGNEVIILTLSSKLSGCYQSAVLAADKYLDKVSVFDMMGTQFSRH